MGPTPGRILQTLLQLIVALVLAVVVFSAAGMQFSASPQFCGKVCHYMAPFYASWQKSRTTTWRVWNATCRRG